jgi:hypothetical protein
MFTAPVDKMGQSNSRQPKLELTGDEPALHIPEDLSSVLGRAYDYDYNTSSEEEEAEPVPVELAIKFKLYINSIWVGTRGVVLLDTTRIDALEGSAREVWDLGSGDLDLIYPLPLVHKKVVDERSLCEMGFGLSTTVRLVYTPVHPDEQILQHPNFLSDLLNKGRTGHPLYDTVITRRRSELGLELSSSDDSFGDGDDYGVSQLLELHDQLELLDLHDPETERLCSLDREAGEGESTCSICLTNLANTVIVPCGHSQYCYSCTLKLKTCGICTKPIQIRQRVFSD